MKGVELYKKYFVDNDFERLGLFRLLKEEFGVESALYLGSFVHITPAFVFPETAFVDNDRRVQAFFDNPDVKVLVEKSKDYDVDSQFTGLQRNYNEPLPFDFDSFDLLISQYAGFVSQAGKKYLRSGGLLVANNSHGDASMAYLDDDFELIAAINHAGDKCRVGREGLGDYFVPKKGKHPKKTEVEELGRGIGYTKAASNYIFRKVSS